MRIRFHYMIALSLLALASCDTEIENIGYQAPPPDVDYEAIRAYRNSDHEIMFGWFGGWNGGGVSSATSLRSLPDSVDMVSIWGDWLGVDEKRRKDMEYVQKVRGVKVLACMFTPRIGKFLTPEGETIEDYWGLDSSDPEAQLAAMRKYAEAIVLKVLELGYDGIDMDNEPEDGNVFGNRAMTNAFIEVIGKYLGPASGTGKIFAIDGILSDGMDPANFKHVNYFISQAYYHTSYRNLDERFRSYSNFWRLGVDPDGTMTEEDVYKALARKFIVTEDFERHAADGGYEWRLRPVDDVEPPATRACIGHASWKPYYNDQPMQKGGAGLYHIENDYVNKNGEYNWTRQMIQTMNTATTGN